MIEFLLPWWKKHLNAIKEHERIRRFLQRIIDKPSMESNKVYRTDRDPYHPFYFTHYPIHMIDSFGAIVRIDFGAKEWISCPCDNLPSSLIVPDLIAICDVDYEPNTGTPEINRFVLIDPRTNQRINIHFVTPDQTKGDMLNVIREYSYLYSELDRISNRFVE